jgi:glycerol-3-phosphate dehydrogenase
VYSWFDKIFYGTGLRVYDLLAGKLSIGSTKILSTKKTIDALPSVKTKNLKGGILYYDGQFDDSRLAIELAYTASSHGATILNYVSLIGFEKEAKKMVAVLCKDAFTGKEYRVKAKSFINATGVFTDHVMQLDESDRESIVRPSQGIHLVVSRSFFSSSNAMMVPKTADGRVFFAVPWHKEVVLGTTDTAIDTISEEPKPLNEEIDFIIEHFNKYNAVAIERKDIQSVFVGLRPLVKVSGTNSTALLSRDHTILVSASGLVTITGGKWTTYRKMAEDAVNNALFITSPPGKGRGGLKVPKRICITENLKIGDPEKRLAMIDAIIAEDKNDAKLLHEKFPYTVAEVIFAIRHEWAETVEDVLARRTRILFLNARVAIELAGIVAGLLAKELGKDKEWEKKQVVSFCELAKQYIVS